MANDREHNKVSVTKRWDELNYGLFQPSKAIAKLRETTVLRIAADLEFDVDEDIAPLIEASWKSGIFVFQSDTWSDVGTVRLHIASAVLCRSVPSEYIFGRRIVLENRDEGSDT